MTKKTKIKGILFSTLALFILLALNKSAYATIGTEASCKATNPKAWCTYGGCDSGYQIGWCMYGIQSCCVPSNDPSNTSGLLSNEISDEKQCLASATGAYCSDDCGSGNSIGYCGKQKCCVPVLTAVPKTGVGSSNPTAANPITGASPTTGTGANPGGASSGVRTGSTGGLVPCTDDCTLCHLVIGFKNIYDYLFEILLVVTTVVIVIAGVMYMISSGNKGMVDNAKKAFTYSLTAIILALVAWLVINTTLHALGYKNVGNWYTFTCDTTQSLSQISSSGGGATLPGSGAGSRSGSYQPSGNLDPRVQKVLENYMTMVGMGYGEKFSGDTYGGKSTADCGSTSDRAWLMAGLPDFWTLPKERWDGDLNSLKPGDICLFDRSATGVDHAFLVMENGKTSGANNSKGIYVSQDGLNYNISLLKGNSQGLYVFHIANYIK